MKLKDPKDWTIAGKPLKRLDTIDRVTGKQVYGADVKLPGMLNAAIKDCPVQGGKVKSFDAAKVEKHAGRQEGRAGRRIRRGGRGRHLVAGQDRARRAADRMGRGRERQGLERHDRRMAQGRPRRAGSVRRQLERRRQGRARFRGEEGRGGLRLPLPEPRADGADERHRALDGRQVRGLGADAEWRSGLRRDRAGVGPAGQQVRSLQDAPRRRLRPARRVPRLRDAGRPDRQADARHAGQAALVARGGHGARPVSPGHAGQAGRRLRQGQQPDRPARAAVGPVDPGGRVPEQPRQGRQGPEEQGHGPADASRA